MKLKQRILLSFLLPLLVLGSGMAQAKTQLLDQVVAIVNDGVILKSELDAKVQTVESRLNAQGTPLPPTDILQKRVLDQLVLDRIQLQMADKAGMRISDNELNQTMKNIAKRNGFTLDQFAKALSSEGLTYREAREQIRRQMLISRIQQKKVDPRVRVTDHEVKAYLDSQAGKKRTGAQYLIGHILFAVDDMNNVSKVAAARKEAESVLKQLKSGADFKQMAVAHSDAQNALDGGVLGWRSQQELPSLIADIVPKMQVGDVSGILKSPSGFHIIKLLKERGGKKKIVTQTKVRHILIKTDQVTSDKDARQKIQMIYNRIENGASFAALARQYSDDSVSGSDGGELGWVSPGDMVPAFDKVMKATPVGKVSQPFRSRYGWHILEVEGRRKHDIGAQLQTNEARQVLYKRKYEAELEDWLQEIRGEAYVQFKPPYDQLEKGSS